MLISVSLKYHALQDSCRRELFILGIPVVKIETNFYGADSPTNEVKVVFQTGGKRVSRFLVPTMGGEQLRFGTSLEPDIKTLGCVGVVDLKRL